MILVAFGKKGVGGGLIPSSVPRQTLFPPRQRGYRQDSLPVKNSFIYIKVALHLCMDIYMHGFPARFIFFIHMLIQVQALQNTNMDSRDYII